MLPVLGVVLLSMVTATAVIVFRAKQCLDSVDAKLNRLIESITERHDEPQSDDTPPPQPDLGDLSGFFAPPTAREHHP